jgi:RNA polymerase sigma-70 factor (ECF subfamily)
VTDANVNKDRANESTSLGLLERVKERDAVAWQRLVTLYSPLVYLWCRRLGLAPSEVEDVGQEVFLAVARKVGTFQCAQAGQTFRGWLWTIARNKVRDHSRKHRAEGQAPGGSDALRQLAQLPAAEDEEENPADLADIQRTEEGILCQRALALIQPEFKEQTWKAFWRVVIDGAAPADVAGDLRISVNSVYLAKARVLRRIREEFAELLPPESPDSNLTSTVPQRLNR